MDGVQCDHAANNCRVSAKLIFPEGITQDHDRVAAGQIFSGLEASSPGYRRSQHGEQIRRSRASEYAYGFSLACEVVVGTYAHRGSIHRPALLLKNRHRRSRIDTGDANQMVWL